MDGPHRNVAGGNVDAPDEAARRFRRFVVLETVAAVAGIGVVLIVLAVVRTALAWPLLAAVAACLLLLLWSQRLYRADRVDAAVLAVCATFWLALVVAPAFVPSVFGGFAVLSVFPVLFAIPYVTRRTLKIVSVATAVSAVVATLLATRAIVPLVSGLPVRVVQVVFVVVSVTFLGLGLTILYAYAGRLGEVVEGLRRANAGLQQSEQSLEQKVAERTAELERSREETAQARDQAVGLSQELAAVLDNLGEGLLVVGPDGTVLRVNRRLVEMLGRPATTLLGRPAVQVLPELDVAPGRPVREVELPGERTGRAVSSAVVGPGGTPRGTVVLLRDITVEREVDRMKTDFISTVSHELRTPLTSILGFTKLIAKRLDDRVYPAVTDPDAPTARAMAQVRGNLDIIVAEGERLTALVNDLLDLAKMEAGRVDWRDEEVDLDAVVRRVARSMEPLFLDKHLPLLLELEPGLPKVRGDGHRLEQVVVNLLSNACKFTAEGAVTVRTRHDAHDVVLSVSDTGPGIAPADRGDLFVRFKQVGDSLTGKPQGTGLGLPICQEIVEHHGGHLDVDSEVGRGSTFSVVLPLPVLPLASSPGTDDPPVLDVRTLLRDLHGSLSAHRRSGPPHILVVDDHQPVRQLLRQELEGHGYVVHEAADGQEAVRMAHALGPDLVTLDVMMPGVDGFDVAAQLRHDPATMRIPIMVVSVVQDEGRAESVGVDGYLTKPVDGADLLAHVEALLAQGPRRRRVLVADADPAVRRTLEETLTRQDWQVSVVTDPAEAAEVARASRYDVVVARADPTRPAHLLEVLRDDPATRHTVVLLYE